MTVTQQRGPDKLGLSQQAGPTRPVPVRRSRLRRRALIWLATIGLSIVCLVWIYPFVWVLAASLKDQLEVFTSGLDLLPKKFVWQNYSRAWTSAHFGTYMANTVIVTVVTSILVIIRCAMAGYVLARFRFIGHRVVLGVLVGTLFVPVGYTIIPVVEVTRQLGLLNSLAGMIIALTGGGQVASVLLYMGYFRRIPTEIEEAAKLDGAGFFRTFVQVMLPLSGPVTATVLVLTVLETWNAFFLPLVFTFSRPDLRTLSVGMQAFVGQSSTDWSGMAAAATMSILPILLLFLFLQRYFFDGIAGAVKS